MNEKLRVLSLFSGIGAIDLGLRRAGGFETIAYCEIDPYCQRVLQARMLDGTLDTAPICTDVRRLDGKALQGVVDLVCGGFPCQDISDAGLRAGIDGEQSGLWREMARLVREIRPRYVFVENVAALLYRGMERVLGDLAGIGYDAAWSVVPSCAMGTTHSRERVFIVANADPCERWPQGERGWLWGKGSGQAERDLYPWGVEPPCPRVADGTPFRLERLAAVGNSAVPQVIEWIGRRLMDVRES